jgi:hypothetical protein
MRSQTSHCVLPPVTGNVDNLEGEIHSKGILFLFNRISPLQPIRHRDSQSVFPSCSSPPRTQRPKPQKPKTVEKVPPHSVVVQPPFPFSSQYHSFQEEVQVRYPGPWLRF